MPTSLVDRPPVTPSPVADRPGGAPPPGSDSLLGRLGGWCFDHRRATLGLWAAVLVVVLAAAGAVGPRLARHLTWSSRPADVLRRACGVIVVVGGLYLVYTAA